ncbi:MAG: GYD domain-containing protein [Promethearchaeota archaeon]|nr:MAG: GYD domain-containing protein [Candidatus Lokiarchaeota archaeon]TKJ22515.1 MAG: GYD family protein [Candidatus Lokiarchaeota archaeon Loki_b32]
MTHAYIVPIFILATKLRNPDLVEKRKEQGEKFLKLVREKVPSIKWIAHYAILGPYDFIDIFEVKNELEATKVSLLSRSAGASFAESWTAIPYTEFLELVDDLK